jgi:hypothetical protein
MVKNIAGCIATTMTVTQTATCAFMVRDPADTACAMWQSTLVMLRGQSSAGRDVSSPVLNYQVTTIALPIGDQTDADIFKEFQRLAETNFTEFVVDVCPATYQFTFRRR